MRRLIMLVAFTLQELFHWVTEWRASTTGIEQGIWPASGQSGKLLLSLRSGHVSMKSRQVKTVPASAVFEGWGKA
jgi:hypothetical protein